MRILSGTFKGRKLLGPGGRRTRPITARVKKSVFEMLGGQLAGAAAMDLYCGTGSWGLEAISRGARRCGFADRSGRAIARLRRNAETLGVSERCTFWCGDVWGKLARWVEQFAEPVDVAFVDPPYAQVLRWDWAQAAEKLFAPLAAGLVEGGTVVFRVPHKAAVPDPLGPLRLVRRREHGDMAVGFLRRSNP